MRGQVMGIHGDNVFVSLGGRNEGVASLRSFREPPTVGDMIEVIISGQSREDGLYNLGIPGGPIVTGDWSDIHEGSIVADDSVTKLRELLASSSLEQVFARLVLRQDPEQTARDIADVVTAGA